MPLDAIVLHGGWLHAHEEDEPGRMVFRPSSYPLPPARGRDGYTFQPGGRVTRIGSGPTDRTSAVEGTWSLDPEGLIRIRMPGDTDDRVLQVLSLDKDRLVVKRIASS